MGNKIVNVIYWVVTTFFFLAYWTQVGSWYNDGVEWYGLIGAGVAANGAFIGNIIWTIITKNDVYKFEHNGKDMPFVSKFKNIFGIK
jgi:hypothetical protein